jgi:hypothetical protein
LAAFLLMVVNRLYKGLFTVLPCAACGTVAPAKKPQR